MGDNAGWTLERRFRRQALPMISPPDGTAAHAGWTVVRKDFVEPGSRCTGRGDGRGHGIPSGHAYILRDADGHDYPFGPDCARALMGDPARLAGIPDYTVRDAGVGAAPRAPRWRGRHAVGDEAALQAAAIRYLVLRMDKVGGLPRIQPSVRFAALEDLHAGFARTGQLSLTQARRILAIEASPATPVKLKTTNLLDVYTAQTKLEQQLRASLRPEHARFVRGLMDWLARHLVLTPAQIAKSGLRLHPRAFALPAAPAATEEF
jgi:hypothetical protein